MVCFSADPKLTNPPITVGVVRKTVSAGAFIEPSFINNLFQPGLVGQIADSFIYTVEADWMTTIQANLKRVIVIGGSGQPNDANTLTSADIAALEAHLQTGGGIVLFGAIYRHFSDSTLMNLFQPLCPINLILNSAPFGVCYSGDTRTNIISPESLLGNGDLWYGNSLVGSTRIIGWENIYSISSVLIHISYSFFSSTTKKNK